jgi:hypothetical protein
MPVTYTIDAKTRMVRTACVGNVTFAEVLEHFREFEKDPNSAGRVDVFLDLSEITSLPAGFQITAVADQLRKIQERVRFNACAVVAQRDALFGMMRMFQVMAEPYFRTIGVFRNYLEAETWLAAERLHVDFPSKIAAANIPGAASAGTGEILSISGSHQPCGSNQSASDLGKNSGNDLEPEVTKLGE